MKIIMSMFLVSTLVNATAKTNAEAVTNAELLERIQKGDTDAVLEAGKTGEKSFIPVLEGVARPHFEAHINPERAKRLGPKLVEEIKKSQARPVYDEPIALNARMALAKLGVKEYLDEILLEATNPTNSPVYKEAEQYATFAPSRGDALWIQMKAFQKLAYVKDRSTVKTLASFLYGRENAEGAIVGGDVIFLAPSEMAMQTLAQIVDNPPKTDPWPSDETHDARIKAWQQWWEQNKGKYP